MIRGTRIKDEEKSKVEIISSLFRMGSASVLPMRIEVGKHQLVLKMYWVLHMKIPGRESHPMEDICSF